MAESCVTAGLYIGENRDLGPTAKGNRTNLQWEFYYLNKTLHEQS